MDRLVDVLDTPHETSAGTSAPGTGQVARALTQTVATTASDTDWEAAAMLRACLLANAAAPDVLQVALAYYAAGLNVIPGEPYSGTPDPNKQKRTLPGLPWTPFKDRRPSEGQVREWFAPCSARLIPNIGILGGQVSSRTPHL